MARRQGDLHRLGHRNRQLSDPRQLFFISYYLPDVSQDFAAQPLAQRLSSAHDSLSRAEDGDSEAAENPRDLGLAGVDAQAGSDDPLHPGAAWTPSRTGLDA